MRITVATQEFAKALYRAVGIADKKSTMPVLAHVLLKAESGVGLTVSATDLDVGIQGTYQADIEVSGSVSVNAKHLFEIIKSLTSDSISLEVKDNYWIEVHSGAFKTNLVGMNAEEFPALPEPGDINTFKVPADALIQMIDRTLFCVSTDDNRHNLSGVYCESTESGLLRMVATDGHRLALSEHQFDCDIPLQQGVIVPRKGFQELKRVLSDGDSTKEVELGFSERNGILKTDSVTLTTRLVEGRFPDYQQVIPSSSNKTLKVSKPRLAEALKRVSLLSQGRAWGVRLSLSTDTLDLVAEDPEFGDARETLAVDYQSEDLTIGFNARYLLDVLQLIKDETVTLMLTDELSPGIIRPLEEQGFLAVVMPVRI